jgi:hypothetical protein
MTDPSKTFSAAMRSLDRLSEQNRKQASGHRSAQSETKTDAAEPPSVPLLDADPHAAQNEREGRVLLDLMRQSGVGQGWHEAGSLTERKP